MSVSQGVTHLYSENASEQTIGLQLREVVIADRCTLTATSLLFCNALWVKERNRSKLETRKDVQELVQWDIWTFQGWGLLAALERLDEE